MIFYKYSILIYSGETHFPSPNNAIKPHPNAF